jgi:fructokinase
MTTLLGCLETGGTTFKVAIADASDITNIIEVTDFPTTTPEETLRIAHEWFRTRPVQALGIASFGPVDLNKSSATYGSITATPKPGWQNTPLVSRFTDMGVPIGFDTDGTGSGSGLCACPSVGVHD